MGESCCCLIWQPKSFSKIWKALLLEGSTQDLFLAGSISLWACFCGPILWACLIDLFDRPILYCQAEMIGW